MISRSRRRRDGWFSFFRASSTARKIRIDTVDSLSESGFALALKKERCRAERRDLSFCIIRFEFHDGDRGPSSEDLTNLTAHFRRRLRITDEIGEFQKTLAVLLPETIPSQAATVANELTEIAVDCNLAVSTDILAYPEINGNRPPANESGGDGVYQVEVDNASRPPTRMDRLPNGDGSVATAHPLPKQATQSDARGANIFSIQRLNTSEPMPFWKRSVDLAGALTGMVLLSPVFLTTALVIRATSRGPAFFTQWREGKDGQLFRIYKFRTMRNGADDEKAGFRQLSEQDGPAFKLRNDPRLTRLGKYLRKSCIDELPQLLNVLKGEMSLVGPRPLPVDESLNCSHWHRRRLDVVPGMTCFWQVQGGRDIPFDEWMRMDIEYVQKRSLWTDSVLIVKTFFVTVLHRGSV